MEQNQIIQTMISIDPSGNGNTGVFVGYFNYHTKQFIAGYLHTYHISNEAMLIETLQNHLNNRYHQANAKPIVVIEDYIDRGITPDNSTKAMIERLRLKALAINPHALVYLQRPACKAVWRNERLAQLQLLNKTSKGWIITPLSVHPSNHSLDAFRHFLYRVVMVYQSKINLTAFFGIKNE